MVSVLIIASRVARLLRHAILISIARWPCQDRQVRKRVAENLHIDNWFRTPFIFSVLQRA